jgi:hypothetical protein
MQMEGEVVVAGTELLRFRCFGVVATNMRSGRGWMLVDQGSIQTHSSRGWKEELSMPSLQHL